MRRALSTVLLVVLGCQGPGKEPMTAAQELRSICDDSWDATLRENPTYATSLGDFRYNDRLVDLSDAGRAKRRALNEGFLERLRRLDSASLDENDRVTADILRLQLEQSLEEERHKFWQWDVDQMGGPQADFPQLLNFHPLSDIAPGSRPGSAGSPRTWTSTSTTSAPASARAASRCASPSSG